MNDFLIDVIRDALPDILTVAFSFLLKILYDYIKKSYKKQIKLYISELSNGFLFYTQNRRMGGEPDGINK